MPYIFSFDNGEKCNIKIYANLKEVCYNYGNTPLFKLITGAFGWESKEEEIATLLLQSGADVNMKNKGDESILSSIIVRDNIAAGGGRYKDKIQFLVNNNAQVLQENIDNAKKPETRKILEEAMQK